MLDLIIYISNLLDMDLTSGVKLHLYADDVLLNNSPDDLHALQFDIDKVVARSNTNSKRSASSWYIVSHKRSPTSPVLPLTLRSHPLEKFKYTQCIYLGVQLMKDLSWSTAHPDYQFQRAGSSVLKLLL